MLCDYVGVKNFNWKLFLLLQEIVDIIMTPFLDDSTLWYFEQIFANLLTDFKALYPQINIRAKVHFFRPFFFHCTENGTMKNFWAMNFKRLNGTMKVPTRITNCFKNPAYTMTYRRQCSVLHLSATTDFQSHLVFMALQ